MIHRSIGSVFRDLHGFNTGQMGTAFLALLVGVLFGFASTIHQERLYQCVSLDFSRSSFFTPYSSFFSRAPYTFFLNAEPQTRSSLA